MSPERTGAETMDVLNAALGSTGQAENIYSPCNNRLLLHVAKQTASAQLVSLPGIPLSSSQSPRSGFMWSHYRLTIKWWP
jgi:hypothetical protein